MVSFVPSAAQNRCLWELFSKAAVVFTLCGSMPGYFAAAEIGWHSLGIELYASTSSSASSDSGEAS